MNIFEGFIKKEKLESKGKAREIFPKKEQSLAATPEEIILASGEVDEKKGFFDRDHLVFIHFKNDGAGIFKPGEREIMDWCKNTPVGTQFKRERAAYLVDKFLGFGLVPSTVVREIDGEIGSVQQFIPDAKMYNELSKGEYDKLSFAMMKLWIFDYIIYSLDRCGRNILVKGDKLHAIDNGLSFGPDKLAVYKSFFNTKLPEEIIECIGRFLEWEDGKTMLRDLLLELLPAKEVEACFRRIEKIHRVIKKYGKIPRENRIIEEDELTF